MKFVITPHKSGILLDIYEGEGFDITKAKFFKFNYNDIREFQHKIIQMIMKEKEKYEEEILKECSNAKETK